MAKQWPNNGQTMAKQWPTSLVASFLLIFIFSGCKKDAPALTDSQSNISNQSVSERENDVSYYLDGNPISGSAYLVTSANDNLYRHQELTVIDETHQHTDAYLFSSRQLYESWGDAKGYKVSLSNQIADRLYFVADSAGIIPANEDSDITPPLWYTNYQNELVKQLNPSNQILCYIGMRLCTSMCNPDIPPGAPGACTDNYVSWQYLVPSQSATLSIMNNKASAWLPKRSSLCVGQGPAHLKAYDKWFFNKYIGTITVNLNFPGSSSVLYVPFNNIYSSYNDKIGSFLTY